MEKYKYTFKNKIRPIDIVEAETLTEAMKKAGIDQYSVVYEFPFMAVVSPVKNQFQALGVTWEKIN